MLDWQKKVFKVGPSALKLLYNCSNTAQLLSLSLCHFGKKPFMNWYSKGVCRHIFTPGVRNKKATAFENPSSMWLGFGTTAKEFIFIIFSGPLYLYQRSNYLKCQQIFLNGPFSAPFTFSLVSSLQLVAKNSSLKIGRCLVSNRGS